jgi:hypothetical protein
MMVIDTALPEAVRLPALEPDVLPARFPRWVGALAGLAAGGLLAAAGWRGLLPPEVWATAGRLMVVAHALAVYALVTLLGERATLLAWGRNHKESALRGVETMAAQVLHERNSQRQRKGAVEATRTVLEAEFARRRWFVNLLCFLIPMFGGLLSLWNLRLISAAIPFREVGLPLIVAVLESMFLLSFSVLLARDTSARLEQWRKEAEFVAEKGPVRGLLPDPPDALAQPPPLPGNTTAGPSHAAVAAVAVRSEHAVRPPAPKPAVVPVETTGSQTRDTSLSGATTALEPSPAAEPASDGDEDTHYY